jgi:hypothetical protein
MFRISACTPHAVYSRERVTYVQAIIVTSSQFSRVIAHVVDSNHDCTLRTRKVFRDQRKGLTEVGGARGAKLRDLLKGVFLELFTNLEQDLLKGQVLARIMMISIEDIEHASSQGSSCPPGRIRQLEGCHIGN